MESEDESSPADRCVTADFHFNINGTNIYDVSYREREELERKKRLEACATYMNQLSPSNLKIEDLIDTYGSVMREVCRFNSH